MNLPVKDGKTIYNEFLKAIIVSIACLSGANVLDDFGISFLNICVSRICVRYI